MSKFCYTITEWFVDKVLEPVDTWVAEQQQRCKKLPWWNPLKWLCWFVTVLVRVVIWVTREILVPIVRVVCIILTFVFGGILLPFGAAIASVTQNWDFYDWVKEWLWPRPRITPHGKKPTAVPGEYNYEFTCHCRGGTEKEIVITIPEDDDKALQLAKDQCRIACA